MNDRIQQLLLQVASRTGEDGEYLPSLHTPEDIERFAQLIVRECSTICKDTAEKQFSPLYSRESDGATICYKKIKEHFGVEE